MTFGSQTSVNAQQVKPAEVWKKKEDGEMGWVKTEPYKGKGAYKTPVVIDGKKYWRKSVTVTSDKPPTRLADVYARWATDSNASLEAAWGHPCGVLQEAVQRIQPRPRANPERDADGQARCPAMDCCRELQAVKVKAKPKPKVLAQAQTSQAPKPKPKAKVPSLQLVNDGGKAFKASTGGPRLR